MKLLAFLVVVVMGFCCMAYSICFGKIHHTLDYDNEKHIGRCFLISVIGCLASVGFVFLPVTVWPLVVIALLVMLFTNQTTALIASALCSAITVMASGQSVLVFFLYFCGCIVTVLVFYGIDESVNLAVPFLIQMVTMFLVETTFICLSKGKNVMFSDFIMPVVNLLLFVLLEIIVIKLFCSLVLFKDRDRYLVINDTEFPLFKECREKNKDVYMHAVHTGYLSEKIGNALQIDSPMIKTAAYYFRIGEAFQGEEITTEYYKKLCMDNRFPKEASELILSLVKNRNQFSTREEAVVGMADAMITAVTYLFKRDASFSPNYEEVVQQIFSLKDEQKAFDNCCITKKELKTIKEILLKETLYYDFLR